MKGILITFEGGEGCGKTTHSKALKEHLERKGRKVVLTREPGGTALGEKIREILLSKGGSIAPLAELMLFASDRIEHVEKVILPALKMGDIVICDRYIDSTTAYQIGGRGLPGGVVVYLNLLSSRGLLPDLTYILDVSPKVGIGRAGKKGKDRFELEDLRFHDKVRKAYLDVAKKFPNRVRVVDSEKPLALVSSEIIKIADKFIKRGQL